MTAPMLDLTTQLKAKAAISADDTLALRRIVWRDGAIDPAEADAIFDLNTAIKATSREWVDFFVEAMKQYVVHQQAPVGTVDDAKAAWLMARIDSDGVVDSLGELELLVEVMEDATAVPASLQAYALRQIEAIVLTGSGPTRRGGSLQAGSIDAAEVVLLRRMLFAQASDGPAMISRTEADMLFRIKDATLGAANAPDWQALFVQAVGNHLMAHSDYHPLARDEAARLDTFMDDTHVSIAGFFGRMAQAGLGGGFGAAFAAKPKAVDRDAAIAADRAIDSEERAWLRARIEADTTLDLLEKALLTFLSEESGSPISF